MKKIFTLAAAILASFSLYAADVTIALTSMTAGTGSYSYEGDEVKAKNNNVYIELPSAGIKGQITIFGSSNKDDRFLYIYGQAGTVKDETRAIVMTNAGVTINYTQEDIITVSEKPYLLFSTSNDFKFKKFNYTYEADKEVDHVVETLTGAAINGVALGETEMTTLLIGGAFEDPTNYVEAPTVTFTVQTDTYYVGEETPSTKSADIDVVAELAAGKWQAQHTVGEQTYTITAVKPATATVTYMDGETVLGTEIVKVGESVTKHGEYEVKPLAEFQGWYTDAELTVPADLTAAVNADLTLYAKFVKAYAESIDFEGMVIINGKDYDVKSVLTANFYDYKTIDALDSLNNAKGAARNEPYLGLKIKKQGGYLACNVLPGTTIRIKFGYVGGNVLAIAGTDTMTLEPDNNKIADLEFPIMVETLVKLQTTSDKTVVIKQIKIDEPIETWMYPITYAEAEHGTVSGWTIAYPDEEVTVAIAPEAGYLTYSLTYNGVALHDDENTGAATFTMPAEDVTVAAEFVSEYPTAIDNSEVEVKAVKVIRDGKLFIEKNGVLYDAQGTVVK